MQHTIDAGRAAVARLCRLAGSGVDLGVLTRGPAAVPLRTAVPAAAMVLALGWLQPGVAHASGGCSVASAPVIASGATQTSDPNACPDGSQFWAIDTRIGDTLTVDVAPSGSRTISLDVYGPNVGTIGSSLCSNPLMSTPYRLSCLIGAAGRYVLVTSGPAV